jgi:hypothetical protein
MSSFVYSHLLEYLLQQAPTAIFHHLRETDSNVRVSKRKTSTNQAKNAEFPNHTERFGRTDNPKALAKLVFHVRNVNVMDW